MPTAALNFSATVDGVLAGHRVDHEQDVVRADLALDRPQLVEHLLVDVQAPRGVEDERREPARAPPRRAPRAQIATGFCVRLAHDRDAELRAERLELVDGRRPVDVGGGQQRMLALLAGSGGRAWRRWSSCPSPAGRSA